MSTTTKSSYVPSNTDTSVIDRVKRKRFRSHRKAFGREINRRPLKRPLLDFAKLSISDSSCKGMLYGANGIEIFTNNKNIY
ncbi:hypothetical protein P3S67_008957 [Capsicum chacoense]